MEDFYKASPSRGKPKSLPMIAGNWGPLDVCAAAVCPSVGGWRMCVSVCVCCGSGGETRLSESGAQMTLSAAC